MYPLVLRLRKLRNKTRSSYLLIVVSISVKASDPTDGTSRLGLVPCDLFLCPVSSEPLEAECPREGGIKCPDPDFI